MAIKLSMAMYNVRRRIGVEFLPWGLAEARMIETLLALQSGERVLEVGSSSGYRIERFLKKGIKAWGIDADSQAVQEGMKRQSTVTLIKADAEDLPFEDGFFDKILSVHLLEHLVNPVSAVEEMARVLKPCGYGVIVVPCERIRGDTAFAGWIKFKNIHLHKFKPSSISKLLSRQFEIVEAFFHTMIPGQFKPMPLDRTPLLYYFSLAMILKVKKLG